MRVERKEGMRSVGQFFMGEEDKWSSEVTDKGNTPCQAKVRKLTFEYDSKIHDRVCSEGRLRFKPNDG